MSHRHEQFVSALKRAVQTVLSRGLNDPRYSGLVTVTDVRVSPDNAEAIIHVSIIPEDRATLTMHAIRSAAVHVRREAADLFETRRMPRLEFRLDESFKKQAKTFEAIARAREEYEAAGEPDATPTDTDTNPTPDASERHA